MSKPKAQFRIAPEMSFGGRFAWIAVLALAGIAIQFMFSLLVGLVFLFAAMLMGLFRTTSNEPERAGAPEWSNVTMEEFEAASALLSKTQRWTKKHSSLIPCSCSGCALMLLTVVGVAIAGLALYKAVDLRATALDTAFLPVAKGGSVVGVFVVDAMLLILPIWMFGSVNAWEPPNLRQRIEQLTHIYRGASKDPRLEWQPSLQVAKTAEGSVPTECRLMARIKDADPDFVGIQIQTTLNEVQGTMYPYTYCVLIAKPAFGLIERAKKVVELPPSGGFDVGLLADTNERKEAVYPRFAGSIVELDTEKDVQIAVVRQGTGGSGYHTSESEAMEVFRDAHELARRVLAAS